MKFEHVTAVPVLLSGLMMFSATTTYVDARPWEAVTNRQYQIKTLISSNAPVTSTIVSVAASTTEFEAKPGKVTGLLVTPNCTVNSVQLGWTQLADADSYQIQSCKGANCSNFTNVVANHAEAEYIHESLTAGLYRYRVRGRNAAGNGAWSDIKQGRIASNCAQVTPTTTSTPIPTAPSEPTEEPSITQTPDQLAGDFDEDGNVSLVELQRVMDAYGQTGNIPENVNTDNEVNLLDVTIVLANFLR